MFLKIFAALKSAFVGALAILTFHQGGLAFMHALGLTPTQAWQLAPSQFYDWPALYVWLVWGAIWGMIIWLLAHKTQAAGYFVAIIFLSAVLPTLVFLFLGTKAQIQSIWPANPVAGIAILNALWGLGFALIMRIFRRQVR